MNQDDFTKNRKTFKDSCNALRNVAYQLIDLQSSLQAVGNDSLAKTIQKFHMEIENKLDSIEECFTETENLYMDDMKSSNSKLLDLTFKVINKSDKTENQGEIK